MFGEVLRFIPELELELELERCVWKHKVDRKMVSPRSGSGSGRWTGNKSVPCDFCSDQVAVLYCRADSAKLCLLCDQHVHSANLLSRKQLRSQICDNCGAEPVSVRCSTDNLFLCHDCDWDAHANCSVSASHHRSHLGGFSGCPSALDLAALWGFDLRPAWDHHKPDAGPTPSLGFPDVMVPGENGVVFVAKQGGDGGGVCSGRKKQVMVKQLVELFKRNSMAVGEAVGDGESVMVPETPNRSGCWQPENVEAFGLGDDDGVFGDCAPSSAQPEMIFG